MNGQNDQREVKPPIGLMPRDSWDAKVRADRVCALVAAMKRYAAAQKLIPVEWVAELGELVGVDDVRGEA